MQEEKSWQNQLIFALTSLSLCQNYIFVSLGTIHMDYDFPFAFLVKIL